jgi:hypothetical protein
MFAPPSTSIVDVRLTCAYDALSRLRPKSRGYPTSRVTLSITEGKYVSSASRKTEGPAILDVGGVGKVGVGLKGNLNGAWGERGRACVWVMWLMMDPAGNGVGAGGGSVGGRLVAYVVGTTALVGGAVPSWGMEGMTAWTSWEMLVLQVAIELGW